MALPTMNAVLAENIPAELKALDQWVCWQYEMQGERATKVPYVAGTALVRASSTDPDTWRSFDLAYQDHLANPHRGVGFVVTEACGIVGIDLDHCVENGAIESRALAIALKTNSYAEISPSGNGLRIFAYGALPRGRRKKEHVEMYASGRYLTVTGHKINDSPSHIVDAHDVIVNLHSEIFGVDPTNLPAQRYVDTIIGDQEILAKMMESKNGGKYQSLWAGMWEGEYPSQSEADLALMNILAYWADGDEGAMRRLFLQSGLGQRSKADRGDYLDRTVAEAMAKFQPRMPQISRARLGESDLSSPDIKSTEDDSEGIQAQSFDGIELKFNRDGRLREIYANFFAILDQHPQWRGRFCFDEFTGQVLFDGELLADRQVGPIVRWFCDVVGFSGDKRQSLRHALDDVAYLHDFDALQAWLQALPDWDGTARLKYWLAEYANASTGQYSSWTSYVIIMQMIARALTPGCIGRYMAIFEGPENAGKSSLIRALGAPWSSVFAPSIDSKESHMAIQGVWVAEIDELDAFRKAGQTRIKSFISQTSDDYVPKFSNDLVRRPRRTVFIGTTNDSNYLTGTTGNTRFIPIKLGKIDVQGFAAARDQIFAEALALFADDPAIEWWEVPTSLSRQLREERAGRMADNVFGDELRQWLDGDDPVLGSRRDTVTWREVFEVFLDIHDKSKRSQRQLQMDLGDALRTIGWRVVHTEKGNVWKRPEEQN